MGTSFARGWGSPWWLGRKRCKMPFCYCYHTLGSVMGRDPLQKLPSPLRQGMKGFLRAKANIRGRGKTNKSPPSSIEATLVVSKPFQRLTKPAAKYIALISTCNLFSGCFLPPDPSALCCQISPPRRGREPFPTRAPGASFQTFSLLCPELWPILQLRHSACKHWCCWSPKAVTLQRWPLLPLVPIFTLIHPKRSFLYGRAMRPGTLILLGQGYSGIEIEVRSYQTPWQHQAKSPTVKKIV